MTIDGRICLSECLDGIAQDILEGIELKDSLMEVGISQEVNC